MAQYDKIAEQYKQSRQLGLFQIASHSMSHWLGDVTGWSVLDLACGEGHGARAMKHAGARRIVGVDISEQMIRLAHETETQQPLGIEYIARAAQNLGRIGEFDVVTGTFLLHYAQNREQLRDMARTAYHNLRPGCRFVTLTENSGRIAHWPELERFGFRCHPPESHLKDGDPMVITLLHGDLQVTFTIWYFSRETYQWALQEAGFRALQWHDDLVLPPDMEANGGREFWAPFMARKPFVVIECRA